MHIEYFHSIQTYNNKAINYFLEIYLGFPVYYISFNSNYLGQPIIFGYLLQYAREPLYSNSAVIVGWLQSTRTQHIIFWFIVIHSMSMFLTSINFHDHVFIWNYHLCISVHSDSIGAFKFDN